MGLGRRHRPTAWLLPEGFEPNKRALAHLNGGSVVPLGGREGRSPEPGGHQGSHHGGRDGAPEATAVFAEGDDHQGGLVSGGIAPEPDMVRSGGILSGARLAGHGGQAGLIAFLGLSVVRLILDKWAVRKFLAFCARLFAGGGLLIAEIYLVDYIPAKLPGFLLAFPFNLVWLFLCALLPFFTAS